MILKAEDLCEGETADGVEVKEILEEIVDQSRWRTTRRFVYLYQGKYYQWFRGDGSTESCDNDWKYSDDIELEEVVPVTVTTTAYKKVSK